MFFLSMIPRVEPEGMPFGKPVPTFPDHALNTEQPLAAQKCEQRQQRQAQYGKVVAFDALEQMHP
jgi:hypothetical protein